MLNTLVSDKTFAQFTDVAVSAHRFALTFNRLSDMPLILILNKKSFFFISFIFPTFTTHKSVVITEEIECLSLLSICMQKIFQPYVNPDETGVESKTPSRTPTAFSDFNIFATGDLTAIGGKGVNMSGGQKARIQLTRAVYSDKDIIILDDPLSAIEAHIGRFMMDECICGVLKGETVILMTN
ncbi:Multidrug resistance-associated protein [Blattamonas nauphoetae]|uniref:Multidrug resistance-associated protein n=1 Tax=Blattamonas nauphoetae TaxID=2049346 RepID=A0ABQ9XP57_9EUKA|nr:Multidrug resistance-associated protein [Blattamonas nauphoetae]